MRYAYLVNVDAGDNHNKFYEIKELSDGSLECRYGRVGSEGSVHVYNRYEKDFYDLVESKERKGYKDVTDLHKVEVVTRTIPTYKPVEDNEVQKVLERIIAASRQFMKKNYTISTADITPDMIDEAENKLARLGKMLDSSWNVWSFNSVLQELFATVPRAMTHVQDYLAETQNDFRKIYDREFKMLQNMKGAVSISVQDQKGDHEDQTVLEARGLTMRRVTYKEEDEILAHLGADYNGSVERRYVRAFAVENKATRKAYEEYKQERKIGKREFKLFYHGSKLENWYSILSSGLLLNPNAVQTGKMFGKGLYFAPECRKALNYMDTRGSRWNAGTEDTGYTAIYSVALGKRYEPNHVLGSTFTGDQLPKEYSSVYASKKNKHLGLNNDEYIVYKQEACTVKYLLEMRSNYAPELKFTIDRDMLKGCFADCEGTLEKTEYGYVAEGYQLPEQIKATLGMTGKVKVAYLTETDEIAFVKSGKKLRNKLTKDDLRFLTRELKRQYADGEYEWENLMKEGLDQISPKEKKQIAG